MAKSISPMVRLTTIIREYESDTFSASGSGVTVVEARQMAKGILNDVYDIVECGGHIVSDGTKLYMRLAEIRDKDY